jgi:hypothetical protein
MSDQALSAIKVIREFYNTKDSRFLSAVDVFCVSNQDCEKETIERNVITFLAQMLRQSTSYIDVLHGMSYQNALQRLETIRDRIKTTPRNGDHDVPSFIIENIEGMQGNRGYIWKGKIFLGKRPAKQGPRVLFEPRRKKTLIHVFEKGLHKVFEKMKGERYQVLIRQTLHKQDPVKGANSPIKSSHREIPSPKPVKSSAPKHASRFSVFESDSESDSD